MVTEDYCSYEVAKLLQEKRFDAKTWGIFREDTHQFEYIDLEIALNKHNIKWIKTYTHQMALKWLREVYNIEIAVSPHEVAGKWGYLVSLHKNKKYINSKRFNQNYEDTIDLVLKEILTHLV